MRNEHVIADAASLAEGAMRAVEVDGRTLLLVKVEGVVRAYGAECPHHGAPLDEGVLDDCRLRCPWHQGVFDARDGRMIEPPPLDNLPRYDVRVEGDDVLVSLPAKGEAAPVAPGMVERDTSADERVFAILGAGAAGLTAAETLRREGYQGRILMITREDDYGYDRTALSKRYLAAPDASTPTVRETSFYETHGVEVLAGRTVVEADADRATLTFADGESMSYDKLLIATGGEPRRLGVEGEQLDNVFTLRSLADCRMLRQAASGASTAVVVGASFIGMEVAAALTQRGIATTVVAPESVPFGKTFGRRIGEMYRRLHEDKGVTFRLGEAVERFDGDGGSVRQARLSGGDRIEADMVVIGVGVTPATRFARGVEIADDESIRADEYLRAALNTFVAGDVARFPDWRTGGSIRIEHWRLAQQQGMTAARNMLRLSMPFKVAPFFWTNQYGVIAQYVGHADRWDDIIFDGDPADRVFLAYYLADGVVKAVAGCGEDRRMAAAGERLRQSEAPTLEELEASITRHGETQPT